jgi:hypothetical protein
MHWVIVSILADPIYTEICMFQDVIIEASDKASRVVYFISSDRVYLLGSYNDCKNGYK